MNQKNTRRGFTLIELLVVVLIIGILAAVAVPQYKLAVAKSNYVQAIVLGTSLLNAERVYKLANGKMTWRLDELDINLPFYENGKAYPSDKKTVACYKGPNPEIYCDMEIFGAKVIWWGKEGYAKCLFNSAQDEATFAEKICTSVCGTKPGLEWDTQKTCFIK